MEQVVKELLAEVVSEHLKCSITAAEIPSFLDSWLKEVGALFRCKSKDDFWSTSFEMRRSPAFLAQVTSFISSYVP
jgi:hypothetical protein